MEKKTIFLKQKEEYITLQSVLKIGDVVSSGGMVKAYLQENDVKVNNESENRRGRKLYPGDTVLVSNRLFDIKKV